MNGKKSWWQLLWLIPLIAGAAFIIRKQAPYNSIRGLIFGTVYTVTYQYEGNLKAEIEQELKRFDGSLSMFNDTSVISKINKNEPVVPDSFFLKVFKCAQKVSANTNGAFDITVAPLVNAWGFGFKKNQRVDSAVVDSLLQITGYQKIVLRGNQIVKKDPRIMLDCSAIAKGYACDVVAQLLEKKGIKNYMVDIGGEVVLKGDNPKQSAWRIGINKPVDDSLSIDQSLQTILQISNIGMATSGNYRNFYYKNGKKYAHTINPISGYPIQHSLLSATVIAKDCMTADAYATSFMVMGLEKAKVFVSKHPELDVYFIYSDKQGKMQTYFTDNMKKYIVGTEQK